VSAPEPQPESRALSGRGSVAGFGARVLAFLIDGLISDVIAAIINGGPHNSSRQSLTSYLAFLIIEFGFVSLVGQTPGMRVVGIVVVRQDLGGRVKPQWVLLRTILLATLIPAVIVDKAGRGMHDRAAGAVMLRVR
jgi:uncharacterized RDD family membrane protein YckC